jgi:chromosome segregation ATPase
MVKELKSNMEVNLRGVSSSVDGHISKALLPVEAKFADEIGRLTAAVAALKEDLENLSSSKTLPQGEIEGNAEKIEQNVADILALRDEFSNIIGTLNEVVIPTISQLKSRDEEFKEKLEGLYTQVKEKIATIDENISAAQAKAEQAQKRAEAANKGVKEYKSLTNTLEGRTLDLETGQKELGQKMEGLANAQTKFGDGIQASVDKVTNSNKILVKASKKLEKEVDALKASNRQATPTGAAPIGGAMTAETVNQNLRTTVNQHSHEIAELKEGLESLDKKIEELFPN